MSEHLSQRLDIKHIKTVTYRPQTNLTERVNRTLVQMIACFVEENHDNWDRFLHEFSFALRSAVNETTGKTPAELFIGRKIITPFHNLINVTDGAEYVGGNIEKFFDEARQNMRKQHKRWENTLIEKGERLTSKSMIWYWYKLISLVLRGGEWSESLCLSLKGHTECWKFGITVGPFGKREEGSQLILAMCGCIIQDIQTQTVLMVLMRHCMKERDLAMGRVCRTRENSDVLENHRGMREPLQSARKNTRGAEEHWDRQSNAEQPQEKEPQHGSLRRKSD
ncbi:retrovirus-related Pol polyprotein from transposon 297 [Trichonephila clavipes]|nr:retrovirus-related Pol polyprotein from transposon 297 [Trichonephila clavipes]